jgi:hypothetical protein
VTVASKTDRIQLTDAQLSRSLGRVFAHELAHHFLGSGHTKHGILKDSLDRVDLIEENSSALFFTSDQIRTLRALTERAAQ